MNASAPDARALPHICVQHRGSPSLSWALRIWVLDLGHSFMRRCTISGPYVSPQEARSSFLVWCVEVMCSDPNQLQSSVELLKLSNFKVVTYSLYFKLWIIASCDCFGEGSASHSFKSILCAQTSNAKQRICFFLRYFRAHQVWLLRALAELCQMNTNTSRVKYSPAVILAFLPSFWICHGGCTQGWLSV